jgi:alkylated DNA repair protein alkB family protein 8
VDAFIRSLAQGSLIADVGCGNGKNLAACNAVGFGLGSDFSPALAQIAKTEGHEVAVADIMNLPYRSGSCDAVLCIAVLHHMSTPARRLRAIQECVRLLRVGGRGLFYAWAQEQDDGKSGHRFAAQDVLVPFHLRVRDKDTPNFAESGAIDSRHVSSFLSSPATSTSTPSAVPSGIPTATTTAAVTTTTRTTTTATTTTTISHFPAHDLMHATHGLMDSTKGAVVFQRYCHVYKQGELDQLFSLVPGIQLCNVYFDTGNWAVLVEKLKV